MKLQNFRESIRWSKTKLFRENLPERSYTAILDKKWLVPHGLSWSWQEAKKYNDNFIHRSWFSTQTNWKSFLCFFASTWDFFVPIWWNSPSPGSFFAQVEDFGHLSKTQKKTDSGMWSSLRFWIFYPNDPLNTQFSPKLLTSPSCCFRGKWASKMAFILVLKGPGNEGKRPSS